MGKFYAVRRGHTTGVFLKWEDARRSVENFKGAEYKSFKTSDEAEAWLHGVKSVVSNAKWEQPKTLRKDSLPSANPWFLVKPGRMQKELGVVEDSKKYALYFASKEQTLSDVHERQFRTPRAVGHASVLVEDGSEFGPDFDTLVYMNVGYLLPDMDNTLYKGAYEAAIKAMEAAVDNEVEVSCLLGSNHTVCNQLAGKYSARMSLRPLLDEAQGLREEMREQVEVKYVSSRENKVALQLAEVAVMAHIAVMHIVSACRASPQQQEVTLHRLEMFFHEKVALAMDLDVRMICRQDGLEDVARAMQALGVLELDTQRSLVLHAVREELGLEEDEDGADTEGDRHEARGGVGCSERDLDHDEEPGQWLRDGGGQGRQQGTVLHPDPEHYEYGTPVPAPKRPWQGQGTHTARPSRPDTARYAAPAPARHAGGDQVCHLGRCRTHVRFPYTPGLRCKPF